MAQKLQIEVEANLSGYTASLKEAAQENVELSDSAIKSAATVSKAYAEVGKVQRAAFGGEETKKALANQNAEIDKLKANLQKLYNEEVELLSSGKQLTESYKKNREEAARVRAEFDKLTASEAKQNQEVEKTSTKSVKLTTQLRALKQELSLLEQQGKGNTKEFEKIAISAARLEDQIGDTQERIKALASDTFVFDAAIDSVSALAGGFAVAQGAIGLFAEDNEELQQAIAKTNSALAILNGLQQVSAFVTGQSAGKLALQNIFMKEKIVTTTAAATATGALATAEEGASVATLGVVRSLNLVKVAIAGTGIGLLVIALVALYQAWKENQEAAERTKKVYDDVAESIRILRIDTEKTKQELIDLNDEILVSEGKITEAEGEKRKVRRDAYKEAFAQNAQALLDRQKLIQLEKNQVAVVEKAASDVLNARENFENLRSQQNQSFLNNAIKREKTAQGELTKIQSQRSKLEDAINGNIGASREKLSKEIKLISLEEQKKAREDAKKRAEDEAAELLKRKLALYAFYRESFWLQKDFNEQIKKENAEAFKAAKGLSSILVKVDDASVERQNRTRIQNLKNFASETRALTKENLQAENQIVEAEGKAQRDSVKAQLAEGVIDKQEADGLILGIDNDTKKKLKDNDIAYRDAVIANATAVANAFQSAFSSIFALSDQLRQNQLADLEEQQAFELSLVGDNAAKRERIEKKFAAEKRKLAREAAVAEKNQALFQAIIATGVAVANALKTPIIGVALAAAAGIAGAAQIATIAATPLPKLERGGRIGGRRHVQGGTVIEAEKDEFVVSRTPAIKHGRELEAMNRSSREYMSLIDKTYVRPAVMDAILTVRREDSKFNVNAKLDARNIESELRTMRRENKKGNKQLQSALASKSNSRYSW